MTEWLPRIFNHLFTRWSLVRTNCVWGLICSMLLQSPMGFEPMNSLPRSGSRFSHLRMGTVSHHHSSKFCISASWWIWTTESPEGGRFTVSRNWPLSETSIKNFSILTHTMEKSASQHNWLLVITLFVEYNIIQFSLYSFTTLPI